MQLVVLAYVSSGSFISLAEDPCRTFPKPEGWSRRVQRPSYGSDA